MLKGLEALKRCTGCGVLKETFEFRFSPSRQALRAECVECTQARSRAWLAAKKEMLPKEVRLCACGCGQSRPVTDAHGRTPSFVKGHNARGVPHTWLMKEDVNEWTARAHARAIKSTDIGCELQRIGSCLGRLHVHHIDKNPHNNDPANLMVLCASHHALVDRGRIDLDDPVMPEFYIDTSGHRRYIHNSSSARRFDRHEHAQGCERG